MRQLTDANSLPSMDQGDLVAQSLQEDEIRVLLARTNSQSSTDSPNLKKKDHDDDDDGGGDDDDHSETEPPPVPDPRYLSGCDFILQLSDYMLNINFTQSVERQKAENRANKDFWDVNEPGENEGDYTKIRYRKIPQLSIQDGQVEVFFPDNEIEAKWRDLGVFTYDCTIKVTATFSLSFETKIISPYIPDTGNREAGENVDQHDTPNQYVDPPTVTQKVFINLSGTAATTPTSPIKANGVEVKDDPETPLVDEYKRVYANAEDPRAFAKVLPDALDVAMIGISPDAELSKHFQVLTSGNYMLIFGVKDGILPEKEKVHPFTTGNDMIVGLSSRLANPQLYRIIKNSIDRKEPFKINDNYELRFYSLRVALINEGFRLYNGSATCFGHAKGETKDSPLYPNMVVTINEMLVFFDGVTPPDGEYNFRLPEPDLASVDFDNLDLLKFILWGIVTHGVGWGGSPLWWFFNPIMGTMGSVAQMLNARKDGDRPSSIAIAPKSMDKGGARVQFVNLSFLELAFVMYGDARPLYPDTSTISGNRIVFLDVEPDDASGKPPSKEKYTFKYSDIWYEDPRYWLRWDLNGRIIKEGPLANDHQVEIGPFVKTGFNMKGLATLSARLYRQDTEGVKEHVYTKTVYLKAVPVWGKVSDYYIHNFYIPVYPTPIDQPRSKLHYATPEKRCPGINRTAVLEHKFWGLPETSFDDAVTTCHDCFGYVKSVEEVRSVLEAEQSRWRKP